MASMTQINALVAKGETVRVEKKHGTYWYTAAGVAFVGNKKGSK